MIPAGIFTGLVAKIVAGITTGLAGVTAVGAAGALPGPAQDAVASVINTITPLNLPGSDATANVGVDVTSAPKVTTTVDLGGNGGTSTAGASATAGTTGASASASTGGAKATTSAGAGTSRSGTNTGATAAVTTPTLPNLPNLSSIPVPACVKDLIDINTGKPKVALSAVSPQVINCVKTLMATSGAGLPSGISQCVNSILGMLGNVTPGSVPNIAGLDISKCVPVDVTACMSSIMALVQNFLPGFGGGGTGGLPGIPNLSGLDLSGCLPFNLDSCLATLFGMAGNLPGVATGGIPGLGSGTLPSVGSLNLSACVPVGSIPGFGSSIPGLGSLSSFFPF